MHTVQRERTTAEYLGKLYSELREAGLSFETADYVVRQAADAMVRDECSFVIAQEAS